MKKKNLTLLALFLFLGLVLNAQENPRNTGLKQAQPASTYPTTKGEIQKAVRKEKVDQTTRLVASKDNELIITEGWELIEANRIKGPEEAIASSKVDTKAWYNATVPGTVLTTLVEQGVYPDPYWGLNNMVIPDTLCRMDWWYRTEFPLPEKITGKEVWLMLNGINYEANIWLNGTRLGNVKGAFIRGEFEVSGLLQETNFLAIHIIPPPHPGIPHEQSALTPRGPNGGELCQDGPTFISSEGWDWVPGIRDRNIGIWQDVRLKITGGAKMIDPQVITDLPLPDTTAADLIIKTELECFSKGKYSLEVNLGDARFTKKLKLKKGSTEIELTSKEFSQLRMKDPKLWWPNGYGGQHLYSVELKLLNARSELVDQKRVRFGVRELTYEFAVATEKVDFQRINFDPVDAFAKEESALFDNINRKDFKSGIVLPTLHEGIDLSLFEKLEGDNPYLIIKVNGQPIFCKGGNWGMDDGMKRVSRERLEPYFKLHKDANYTMIRNWTGESTEEVFYELADEYGMLVWNDFWMSTEGYNMPPTDHDLFMANATDVVKRFRNHPSIALWCARNEGYAPKGLDKRLADLVAKEDGSRLYQSNSRYLNLRHSGPWHYIGDINFYFNKNADGFSTEVGTQSFPTVESLEAMMSKEDLWPISDGWYYHDLHTAHWDYRSAIIADYAEAFTVEEFIKKAQMVNYISHRAIFEAWNSKLWDDASGVLLWMTHPAWPAMIWQTYSSDYETYGAYYGAKKACEPIHIQMNNNDRQVIIVNTTLEQLDQVIAKAEVLDENGTVLHQQETKMNIPSNSKASCFKFKKPNADELPEVFFIKLTLRDAENKLLSDNIYWETNKWNERFYRFNLLEKVSLKAKGSYKIIGDKVKGKVMVSNPSSTLALTVKLNLRDAETGNRVLPAYFSDGYFILMPGEVRDVEFECKKRSLPSKFAVSAEGYNVERQTLIEW